ncbi:3-keto-5-aminohexanoate cleavage protein [Vulgatibacter incomptus]|uniref:3-keto-5-aminohexanoate cleavage enzyme n=1 Tax=Vulgatibacter incomptus TaxID=1391653 RepID=A0A0K1PDL7_9BACT|nr:3-keto-5-aminohexanoate cleavage protein [Vulgatibacter incomptus]AKU91638.1 3-keto-5-aminohexanoate cleavage enzyme [Vulgatibacter incomptus]
MNPVVITAALVGAETTREQTPYLPISPEEIAQEAKRCRDAGASIVHLHVREPDGKPSQSAALFRETIERIRVLAPDLICQTSTGGAVGMDVDERAQPLTLTGAAKPEMATVTTGTVNFGNDVFWNPRSLVREIAKRIRAGGIVPEIECFDAGMIDEAFALQKEGLLDFPAHFDFVLGVPGALAAKEAALDFMRSQIPEGSTWTVAGVGRHQLPMAELALEKGGNVRVGLEDNIYLSKGVLAKGSYELVARVAELAAAKGRAVATPDQARGLLRVPPR